MQKLYSFIKSLFTSKDQISLLNIVVSENLKDFVKNELLPELNNTPENFWYSLQYL